MTQTAALCVRGMAPVPWGSGNNEWKWRGLLAEQGRLIRANNDVSAVSITTHFSVDIVFLMNGKHIERADLDNLAKPVLDTLFRIRYPQVKDLSLTGTTFDVDDDRVFKLTLQKRFVSNDADEGADVTITWE